jgi:glucose-1-phosphate cytidylyltransferase
MEPSDVPVVILCGGKGTRLREETEYKPKPMVEVGGKPILWHIMRNFAADGFQHFVLCLGYRGDMIREYFLHYRAMTHDVTVRLSDGAYVGLEYHGGRDELAGCSVTLVETGAETMTGGRVARAAPYLTHDRFIVTYGDAVSDINAAALLRFHVAHGRTGTMTVVQPASRFGVAELARADRVASFSEKPRLEGWINVGHFVFEREFLARLSGDSCTLEHEPLRSLAGDHQLNAFRHRGFWQPMDTFREYELLNDLWNTGTPPWLSRADSFANAG